MKKISIVILFSFIFFESNYIAAQNKNVYWVHGMGGDATSMSAIRDVANQSFYINSLVFGYSTDYGITGSANILQSDPIYSPNQYNIFIAHSMGGVNSRYLYYLSDGTAFGGLITLGSPHGGAPIAENLRSGVHYQVAANIVDKGCKGVINEFFYVPAVFSPGLIFNIQALTNSTLVNEVISAIANELIGNLGESVVGSSLTRDELCPTSDAINTLNNEYLTIPTISIWGNEDSPTLLRLGSIKFFGNNDNTLPQIIGEYGDFCESRKSFWDLYKIFNPWNPLGWYLASCWKESENYMKSEFEGECNVLIGAYRFEGYYCYEYYDYVCDDIPNPYSIEKRQPIQDECDEYVVQYRYVPRYVPTENDGLLPKETVMALPGCSTFLEIRSCNHFELKFHDDAIWTINEILMGNITTPDNTDFFRLNLK